MANLLNPLNLDKLYTKVCEQLLLSIYISPAIVRHVKVTTVPFLKCNLTESRVSTHDAVHISKTRIRPQTTGAVIADN